MKTYEKLPESLGPSLGGTYEHVEWELGDQYDDAGDGHEFMHHAEGVSPNGHLFYGTGIVIDGQWDDVVDVEYQGLEAEINRK